jgi:hypothetical protein
VSQRLAAWRGEDPRISRQWAEDGIAPLTRTERPAGCLAMLAAFAPYQVDDAVVEQFMTEHPGDDT